MLTIQYRMHPAIRQFPSDRFYHSLLVDAPSITEEVAQEMHKNSINNCYPENVVCRRLVNAGIPPLCFFDTVEEPYIATGQTLHRNQRPTQQFWCNLKGEESVGTSFKNDCETAFIQKFLQKYISSFSESAQIPTLQSQLHPLTIAIITPYKAQVRSIKDMLMRSFISQGATLDIEVNSVDGFQGREKDVVIFSCVRSCGINNYGRGIGFLGDERRLNVALTRAKKALVIVGDSRCLRRYT
jgi:superfamily I DNA and/or RNA helicase